MPRLTPTEKQDIIRFLEADKPSLLRKLALMMLKRHPSKLSLAGKQWNAALNPQFLEEVLLANANVDKI